jgi:CubicO group peptidase (beta-lactamase class C family)
MAFRRMPVKRPSPIRLLVMGAGSLLVLALVVVVVGYLLAPHFYLTRTIFWGESDQRDLEKFPARIIHNAPPTSRFDELPRDNPYASQIESIARDSGDGESLEDFLDASGTTAFLVVHDDEVLYERYFDGYEESSVQTSFSMAKSFASALVGIAIEEGHIKSVDEPITDYLPELLDRDERFRSVTIRHLLTMSSGIKYEEGGDLPWSDEADDTKTYYATDLRELALENCRIEGKPGEYFEYNNYNPLLVGMILERATGMPVARYMEEKLWKPMGMEADGSWSLDSTWSGFEKMESGVNARARDFARFGMLFAKEGNWRGEQLISRGWVEESTRADTSTDPSLDYQYFWWVNRPDGKTSHFSARGKYGQYIYVDPAKDLVIVRLGKEEREQGYGYWIELFEQMTTRLDTSVKGSG